MRRPCSFYTLRDESNHIKFGSTLINKIKEQHPEVWTEEFVEELTVNDKITLEIFVEWLIENYDIILKLRGE